MKNYKINIYYGNEDLEEILIRVLTKEINNEIYNNNKILAEKDINEKEVT